jgi:hypothetical protein
MTNESRSFFNMKNTKKSGRLDEGNFHTKFQNVNKLWDLKVLWVANTSLLLFLVATPCGLVSKKHFVFNARRNQIREQQHPQVGNKQVQKLMGGQIYGATQTSNRLKWPLSGVNKKSISGMLWSSFVHARSFLTSWEANVRG